MASSPRKGNALSTLESMLAGLLAGSATTIASNPLWVIQTTQAVRTLPSTPAPSQAPEPQGPKKKLGFLATIRYILRTDGPAAFWRGIGPALVLVINPILQYTVFEQLKNALVAQRTAKLRAARSKGIPTLTSLDYFLLGALSKLGRSLVQSICDFQSESLIFSRDNINLSVYRYQVAHAIRTRPHPGVQVRLGWADQDRATRGACWLVSRHW